MKATRQLSGLCLVIGMTQASCTFLFSLPSSKGNITTFNNYQPHLFDASNSDVGDNMILSNS